MQKRQWSRGSLARETGVNIETIRYYENAGLIPEPPRTYGGHRVYDEPLLKRLSFIRRCRELGFTLAEVRGLLDLVDGGDITCAQVLASAKAHLVDIKAKIRDLRKMQKTLKNLADQCTGEDIPDCPIVDALWNT